MHLTFYECEQFSHLQKYILKRNKHYITFTQDSSKIGIFFHFRLTKLEGNIKKQNSIVFQENYGVLKSVLSKTGKIIK